MECTPKLWMWGIISLLTGALMAWAYMRKLLNDLKVKGDKDLTKIVTLENEYANLRSSTQSQILDLETKNAEIQNLIPIEQNNAEYDALRIEYDSLLSKYHELERSKTIVSPDTKEQSQTDIKRLTILESENKKLKKSLKAATAVKIDSKSNKKVKKLIQEIKSLKAKLKKQKKAAGIEKRVEIIKSIRRKKLKDWLSRDKSYKVRKKVSKRELKN